MISRRSVLLAIAATIAGTRTALAHKSKKTFILDPLYEPQQVPFPSAFSAGTVIVDTANRFLYLVETDSAARRYGLAWSGTAEIGRKTEWPAWKPTKKMIRRNPKKYLRYAKGLRGGRNNPLGSRALYLYRNGQDTFYRIHGTTEPWTIGRAVSNGCIRMVNVEDLFERAPIGTKVVVLRR